MNRVFFVAGEPSGDIHGANLIRALREAAPSVCCEGLGGELMAEAGMDLRYDLAGHAIMGFTEVLRSLGMIRRLFLDTLARLEETKPDCLVVIDYPGFNLRLAKKAKALGIPVVYYISPQVWAWKRGRVHTIAETVEKVLVILPFEEKIYRDVGVDCTYVGHPLLDHIPTVAVRGAYRGSEVIGLLPGSREQEVRRLMEPMIEVARGIRAQRPEARFVVPCVSDQREAQVRALAGDFPLETVVGQAYEVLDAARFCMVASGTATLEAAMFGVPHVILYKVSPISYWLARRLVRVDHIGLANILAERRVVPEFIQHEACTEAILPTALELLADSPARRSMVAGLEEVRGILGGGGASKAAAQQILELMGQNNHG